MTAAAKIKGADATRLLKAAKNAGWSRARLTIDPLGNIVMDASNDGPDVGDGNPLDRLLRR